MNIYGFTIYNMLTQFCLGGQQCFAGGDTKQPSDPFQ